MDNSEMHEKWPEIREKIIKLHPEMTQEELVLEIGREEELFLKLQKKLGKTNKEIRNWLSLMG